MAQGNPSASKPKLKALVKHDFEKLAGSKSPIQNGYVYVPKGDVYVTRNCRDFTGARGRTLYVVFDEKTHERLGLRCPTEVFREVTANAGVTAIQRKDAVLAKDRKHIETARESLVRLFPRIPLDVAERVLQFGFEKGSGRVGRAGGLESDERVTLAVVAHARHKHTAYDRLIRGIEKATGHGKGARERATEAIRDELELVLKSWRAPPAQLKASKPDHKVTQKPQPKIADRRLQNKEVQKRTIPKSSRLSSSRPQPSQGISKSTRKYRTTNTKAKNTAFRSGPFLDQMAESVEHHEQEAERARQAAQLADQKEFASLFVIR